MKSAFIYLIVFIFIRVYLLQFYFQFCVQVNGWDVVYLGSLPLESKRLSLIFLLHGLLCSQFNVPTASHISNPIYVIRHHIIRSFFVTHIIPFQHNSVSTYFMFSILPLSYIFVPCMWCLISSTSSSAGIRSNLRQPPIQPTSGVSCFQLKLNSTNPRLSISL